MVRAQIEMSADEFEQIESRAHTLGYETVSEYFLSLAHDDLEYADAAERSTEDVLDGIKTSMRQALRGEGRPARELLDELNNDN
jgi:histone H3/H4